MPQVPLVVSAPIRITRTLTVVETVEITPREESHPRAPLAPAIDQHAERFPTPQERFFALASAFVHHGFSVLLVVWIPVAVQFAIVYFRHWSVDPVWLAIESYGIAFLTSFALFAELLKEGKEGRVGRILHSYNMLLRWLAPIVAMACILAIAALALDRDSEIATLLSDQPLKPMIAVLIAALLYLSYEIPTLWAATEVLEKVVVRNRCTHCGAEH
jgi:hypothetical protein